MAGCFFGVGSALQTTWIKSFSYQSPLCLPDLNSIDLTSVPGLYWAYVTHFR